MVDRGPPAPQPSPVIPPVVPPAPPIQSPTPLAQPIVSPTQSIQPALMPQLNKSHFKLEFAGKQDKDAEVHLLRTNDWMDTHAFKEGVKASNFFNISRRGKVMV